MPIETISQAVESNKVVLASAHDGITNRLALVVGALDAALLDTANAHAAGQLSRFARILCRRCGGDICERAGEFESGCSVSGECVLPKKLSA